MQQLVIDYKTLFNSDRGKRVLADLEEFAGYNKSSFVPGLPDHTHFNEGQRNIILRIKALLAADEEVENEIENAIMRGTRAKMDEGNSKFVGARE